MAEQTADIGEQLATIERKPPKDRISEYARLEAPLRQTGVEAEAGLKAAELKTDIAKREAGAKALREQVGLEEKELQAGRQQIDRYELPTFKPSQEGLTDYARLGSMVMTLGMMLGRGGKDSGLAAINAMSGALQGWRQGRKDIYERELKQFDKEFQKIKELRGSIEKDLTRAMQLWPTKRKEAVEAAEAAAYKSGVDSIMSSYIRAGKYKEALALIKSSRDLTAKAIEQENRIQQVKEREAAADRRHRENMRQRAELAKMKMEAQTAKGGGGLLKPGAEVTKNYLGQNALLADMQDISKDLKDPKIRKLIDDYRLEGFASEELGKIVAQIANDELPSELRKFLVKVRNVRNNYYLTISGKAVTGGEALRNYGVVSQPGDSAASMTDKTDSMIKQVDRTVNQYQKLYGLPKIEDQMIGALRSPSEQSNFDIRSIPIDEDIYEKIPNMAKSSFGSYEPDKYDYRINPQTGGLQRKQKE